MATCTSLFIMSSMFWGVPAVDCAEARTRPPRLFPQICAIAFPIG